MVILSFLSGVLFGDGLNAPFLLGFKLVVEQEEGLFVVSESARTGYQDLFNGDAKESGLTRVIQK